ncbi:MAG TPA: cyanophycin synthetase [Flavobacteriales bacterium]|nr:cyanophycin synthetase [Flavobacteriales bacterium]
MNEPKTSAPLRIAGGQLLEARRAAMAVWGPHRMEAVCSSDDVLYVNDSRSTFLDAALEALATLDRRTIWIVGTWSEEMGDERVQALIKERVRAVVLFGALVQGSEDTLPQHTFTTENLRAAVLTACELAQEGEVVLFSPACPSGNGYANYEERGAEFKRVVREITNKR